MTIRLSPEQLAAHRRALREGAAAARQRVSDALQKRQQQRRQQVGKKSLKRQRDRDSRRRAPAQEQLLRRMRNRKRWRATAMLAGAAFLFWLLSRCDTEESTPPLAELVCEAAEPCPSGSETPKKPRPRNAKLAGDDRDRLGLARARAPKWLSAFRFQVAARSPRIARCFDDATAPGMLRLSTTVAPKLGTLSASTLEPMGTGSELSAEQERCVLAALAPPYRLEPGPDDELGTRVTLVLEF